MKAEFFTTYTSSICANDKKMKFLTDLLSQIEEVSVFLFEGGLGKKSKLNIAYEACREKFPDINSKILQNFIREYIKRSKKKPLSSPMRPSIYLDQNFDVQITDNKMTSHWLRFSKKNFPLFGKYLQKKVTSESKIKTAQIFKKGNKVYCRLTISEVKELNPDIDFNSGSNSESFNKVLEETVSSLDGSFKTMNGGKKKDLIHKLTSKVVKDLLNKGTEVLILEDYESLSKSVKSKSRKQKEKLFNGITGFPCGLFRDLLKYKCIKANILVIKQEDYNYEKEHKDYKIFYSKKSSVKESKTTNRLIKSLVEPYGDIFVRSDGSLRNLSFIHESLLPFGEEGWNQFKDSELLKECLNLEDYNRRDRIMKELRNKIVYRKSQDHKSYIISRDDYYSKRELKEIRDEFFKLNLLDYELKAMYNQFEDYITEDYKN